MGAAYLAAASLPLFLSSRRAIFTLGAITLVGSVTAYFFYWEAFLSVWCFFAALGSVAILGHFGWARRQAPPHFDVPPYGDGLVSSLAAGIAPYPSAD